MSPQPIALQVKDLVRSYGKLLAVDHLSLQVRQGEVFGFLGPNGAGKTTSIRMMCGLLKPDSGEVLIDGTRVDPGDAAGIRARVGICPQENILWSKLTCFEQLVFSARMYNAQGKIARERADRLLAAMGLEAKRNKLAGTSLVQIIIAMLSLGLALLTAVGLGYTLIPGTLGFILLISFLTALSMISFSLLVAAMCRSIKEVAIIGTFPLFLLMFFTGAAFPISGGELFTIAGYTFRINDILSPTWAVDALNKVLVRGLDPGETITEMIALVVLTILYFFLGTWAFRARHMKPA